MNPQRVPPIIRLAMRLYPKAFRARYQADYEAFLLEQRSELAGGWISALAFWGRQVIDIGPHALKQRFTRTENRKTGGMMTGYLNDLLLAMRMVRRDPVYVLVAVATLALGIGATTGIFTVVDRVLLRPPPYPEPDRLVEVYGTAAEDPGHMGNVAWPDLVDLQTGAPDIRMAAYHDISHVVLEGGAAQEIEGAAVGHELLEVLGVSPAIGRGFTPEEDVFEGPRVLILSHRLWVTRFGSDPGIVDRSIQLDDGAYTVVGVMGPGFAFPTNDEEYWTPLHEDETLVRVGMERGFRGLRYLNVVGRLGNGVSEDQATATLQALFQGINEIHREGSRDRGVGLMSLRDFQVAGVPESLLLFMWASLLVLAIACANVASVTLSRGISRSKEFAVRSAIGAPRAHTMRLVLTESLLVGLVGGAFGIGLASLLLDSFVGLAPEPLLDPEGVSLDRRVLTVTIAVAVLSSMLAGALPALRAARTDPAAAMRAVGRGAGPNANRHRAQRSLILAQMVLSIVLMTGAGLMLRSFNALRDQDLGFNPTGILTAAVNLPTERYEESDQRLAFYEGLFDRLEAIPGVTGATATYSLPFGGTYTRPSILLEGETREENSDPNRRARVVIVDPDYLDAMSVPLLAGRRLMASDGLETPTVAVVNQVMAESFWPGQDPIGQVFKFGGSISGTVDSIEREYFARDITVVGVAGTERRETLAEDITPEFYLPYAQMPWWSMALIVKTTLPTASVVPQMREAMAELDPAVPLDNVRTLQDVVDGSAAQERMRSVLSSLFAAIAALLTMVGVYGVASFGVSQRVREIGIRMALGAQTNQVRRGVLSSSLNTTVVAMVIGIPTAFVASRFLASMLFGVSPADLLTYVVTAGLILVTTLVASYLPARRASLVDPMTVIGGD